MPLILAARAANGDCPMLLPVREVLPLATLGMLLLAEPWPDFSDEVKARRGLETAGEVDDGLRDCCSRDSGEGSVCFVLGREV